MGILKNFFDARKTAWQPVEAARTARWNRVTTGTKNLLDNVASGTGRFTITPIDMTMEGVTAVGKGIGNGAASIGKGIGAGANAVGSGIGAGTVATIEGIGTGASVAGKGISKAWNSNLAYDIQEVSGKALGHGTAGVKKFGGMGWKAGKYAAIGGALLGGLALVSRMGRKPAESPEASSELDFDASTFTAPEVPSQAVLPPLSAGIDNSAIGANTLMGLQPVEGEHVAALGRSGPSQGFAAQRPPQIAEDMGSQNVTSGQLGIA